MPCTRDFKGGKHDDKVARIQGALYYVFSDEQRKAQIMKIPVAAACALLMAANTCAAEEIKLGVLFGFTGPIESLTPDIAAGAELAMSEVTESGALLDGSTVTGVRGDSTCVDSAAAIAAAERLITSDGVNAIVGADCSGVTGATLQNVARPNGIVMISPSATSPALSEAEDDGLFFRTAPSDARQGQLLAELVMERGFSSVAVTYVQADYGKGLADSFSSNFEAIGGTVTISVAHEDGKSDYAAEAASLDAAGGDALFVGGYLDQGGLGIIQASLDSGSFETFILPDGMQGDSLVANVGADLNGSFGTSPGSDSDSKQTFVSLAEAAGVNGGGPYVAEAYDAASLILLAMQAAGSSASADLKDHIMDVANAPGEEILPGELAKGLEILSQGGDINYVGASDVELIGPGESAGRYQIIEVQDGSRVVIEYR